MCNKGKIVYFNIYISDIKRLGISRMASEKKLSKNEIYAARETTMTYIYIHVNVARERG